MIEAACLNVPQDDAQYSVCSNASEQRGIAAAWVARV